MEKEKKYLETKDIELMTGLFFLMILLLKKSHNITTERGLNE